MYSFLIFPFLYILRKYASHKSLHRYTLSIFLPGNDLAYSKNNMFSDYISQKIKIIYGRENRNERRDFSDYSNLVSLRFQKMYTMKMK